MLVRRRRVGDVEVVALDGEVDLAALPALHQALARAIDDGTGPVAVDLDGVLFLDDPALGVVVGAAARARRRDVPFSVVCTDARLRNQLAETRVDRIVDVVDRIAPA